MILSGSLQPSTKTQYAMPDGTPSWATEILNAFASQDDGPHTYLAEQSPNYSLRSHFHNASQFQIVVEGEGNLGHHDLRPIVVHYTERQNGYGPIVSNDKGLAYMVLRPIKDTPQAHWLPESVKEIDKSVKRRQMTSTIHAPSAEADLRARTKAEAEIMIAPDANGLASWLVRLGPGMKADVPGPVEGQGRFYVAITGSMIVNGKILPRLSTSWVPPGESIDAKAGPEGADIAVLQFPRESWIPA